MGGAGGMSASNSSAASSGTGDQKANIGFQGGSINFGSSNNNQLMIIGAIAIAAILLFKK
ncbi:hypothetical protein [Pseudoalteromonas sp. MEBiC 03485]|jgi:diaminopimelate epimerase|uniref:hypothetical protein n=1 Tax=Pseudoalteromonas sp. MEBiC 03485 TaxID=2571103 RepID=UPI00101FBAE7|nr:hypothetical protein [Pseudoalteromonas sp. MEBiC 03485]RZD19844.1 hypothetical protein EVU92_17135 [Pseudoalteromonas sp. MEBiC 03485]